MPQQIQSIISNLRAFGVRRLAMLAGIAALVMAVIGIGSVYLNRPAYETLYVGLDRSDVNQIGLVLADAGIGFDVGSDGTSVLVPAGTTAQARMLLAEKGLPTSTTAVTPAAIDIALGTVETALAKLSTGAAYLGAAKSRVDTQKSFLSNLSDSIDKGVGALVDADMNKESTRLQALQVQQQLGIQALSIANGNSQSILALFKQ